MISGQYNGWSFDVSAFMVLLGEGEEQRYRLSGRDLLQSICAAPVEGLQSYIRSYAMLMEPGGMIYFSVYGGKSAPLRNPILENAIVARKLLDDGKFSICRIVNSRTTTKQSAVQSYRLWLWLWICFTWVCYGGILAFLICHQRTSWIGMTNCVTFTGWSIVVRLIEFLRIKPAEMNHVDTCRPTDPDAVFILGRRNSAFVLEGDRRDVKDWTGMPLSYEDKDFLSATFVQALTRSGSFLVLALIFITIPNGTTYDQLAFVMLNVLGHIDLLVSQRLNCFLRLTNLEIVQPSHVRTRTHVYGNLVRRYNSVGEKDDDWVEKANLLPKKEIWKRWRA